MLRIATLATAFALILAAPAVAKVWFQDMGGRTVRWDQRVVATITNCASHPACGDVVRGHTVFVRAVHRHGLRRVGTIDAKGRIRFRVPHLAPGPYRLYADDGGRTHYVSASFRIRH